MENNLKILLIEDDAIEVMKFKRVLSKMKESIQYNLNIAQDGEQALEFLKSKLDIPDIILLDLNMPKIGGIEFLSILKADETLKYIPTIILSTSNNEKDLLDCYKIGIAGYVVKPLKYEEYVLKIEKLLNYWSINQMIKL